MKKFKWVKYLIAFLVPMLVAMVMCQNLDNDSWGVLAQGRYITENGLYDEDVLSMHEGLPTVIQNYSFSVFFYLIHSAFGAPGIYIVMLILNFVVLFLLYKICMLIGNKNVKLSLILMAATGSLLAFVGFVVTRAQMIDYIVFLALIYVLELFIKTDKSKYLWWVPVLSLVLVNFHSSVWWIIFAIMTTYIIDGLRKPKKILQGYRLKPMILIFAVSAVVGVINPYGLKMITSIFSAYGGMADLGFVSELHSFSPTSSVYNFSCFVVLVAAFVLYIYAKRKVRIRYLLMTFGFLLMGMTSVKGMSELILVMLFPLAFVYQDFKVPELFYDRKIGRDIALWMGTLVTCLSLIMMVTITVMIEDRPSLELEEVMDAIDGEVGDRDKRELKVYVGYNGGGYVEYRGYPAYLDPRGAEFMKSINGKEGILEEWLDLGKGVKIEDFLGKYNFDFLVVEEYYEDAWRDLKDERYELIYDNEESGTKAYKKVEDSKEV